MKESPNALMVNRDSGTRRASRLGVQFEAGELSCARAGFAAEKVFQRRSELAGTFRAMVGAYSSLIAEELLIVGTDPF